MIKPIIYLYLIITILFSCSEDNSTEPINTEPSVSLYANQGISGEFGIFIGEEEFAVNIPATGDYHLQYTTANGTYDIVFHVQDSALIFIEPENADEVQTATVSKIDIPDSIKKQSKNFPVSDNVTLYFDSGDIIPWDNFLQDPGFSDIVLIDEGSEVSSAEVIVLEKEDVHPELQICIGEHTLTNSYNVFACQISEGFKVDSTGWYWIRMSIGFEIGDGEAEARAARPQISLTVTLNGVSLSMDDTTIVEYNQPAGFWEVNAYYCTGTLEKGKYKIVGKSYNKTEYVDSAVCVFTVK